jgi:hypothetical protein
VENTAVLLLGPTVTLLRICCLATGTLSIVSVSHKSISLMRNNAVCIVLTLQDKCLTLWLSAGSKKSHSFIHSLLGLTYSLTHGAEPFLRSCQLYSHARTSQHFMEPKGSLPWLKILLLFPILSQINSILTTSSYFFKNNCNITLQPTRRSLY